jgi:PAS domain S-box-containing protein
MIQYLITNAALLITLSAMYGLLDLLRKQPRWRAVLTGVLFGGIAVAGMTAPVRLPNGIIYDGRSIVLTLTGLFGGGVAVLIAAAMAGIYRAILGGAGVWAGLATIATCSIIGLIVRRSTGNNPAKLSLPLIYSVGIVTHVAMLVCQLLLPWPQAFQIIGQIWLPVILVFPAATLIIGLLLRNEEERLQTRSSLEASERHYHDLVETSQDLIWQCDAEGRYTYLNPAWEAVFGYKIEQMLGKKFTDFQTPEYATRDLKELAQLLQGKTVQGMETIHLGKDGREINLVFNAKLIVDEKGKPAGTRGTAYDITERKRAEESYQAIFENAPVGIFQSTPEGCYIKANQALADIYGYASPEEMLAEVTDITNQLYVNPSERLDFQKRLLEYGEVHGDEVPNRRKDGSLFWITRSARTVKNATGEILYYEGFLQDISDRKLAEQALRESEERFRHIFEGVQDAIFVETPTGEILDVNQRACEMFGYSRDEFLTKTVADLVPPGSRVVYADANDPASLSSNLVETTNLRANGETFPVELSARLQNVSGKPAMLVVVRDITERKRNEQAIRAALRDKDVLLRELYHRTKNNMQVISSLLNMEADRCGSDELRKTLRDMDTRILAMSLVHEKLYQSKNLDQIDLKDYLSNLAALVMESYDVRPDKVRLSIEAESVTLPIESAIPCGLLVNEIISNSLKHAFPGKRTGEINIRLTRLEGSQVLLEISDNGTGIPKNMDLPHMKSLGMRIIFGIAGHQLHAQVQVDTTHGVSWRIHFPNLAETSESELPYLQ